MSPGPVLTALRTATRSAHDRLERRLDAFDAFAKADARVSIVISYYRLHGPAEAHLAPWLFGIPDLDYAGRQRAPLIQNALAELGVRAPASPGPRLPKVQNAAEALGFLYVLEGSSLGGRMIRRNLARRGVGLAGLEFLDPYGAQAGVRWAGFLRVLEREAGGGGSAMDCAVSGAIMAFAHSEACLCGDAVPA